MTTAPFPRSLLHRLAIAAIALAASVLPAGPAAAASLQVSPILLEFAPQEQAQALWLSNTGHAPLHAQVRVMHWRQAEGEEALSPTRDLVASPALVEIAPGERQLVRIVRPQAAPATAERAYRVIVDELPGEAERESAGLQFLLRYSIPAFVDPVAAADGGVPPRPSPAGSGVLTDLSALSARWLDGELQVSNDGGRRVRISQLEWINADGSRVDIAPGLLGYVLAGQRMHWPLQRPDAARPGGTFTARFNHDGEARTLPLADPVR